MVRGPGLLPDADFSDLVSLVTTTLTAHIVMGFVSGYSSFRGRLPIELS